MIDLPMHLRAVPTIESEIETSGVEKRVNQGTEADGVYLFSTQMGGSAKRVVSVSGTFLMHL